MPLFGRDAEQSELNAFLEDPSRRFGWKLVLGSGGVGKSRIALELVLARRAEWWHAGFLDEQPPLEYWAKWQPARPTLIVIDYASRESIYVGKMLASLAEREPPFLLQHPVRALLLERNTIGPWLENILGASRLLLGSTTKAPDLTLGPLTDVWLIFEYILGAEATTHYTRSTILATLKRIDAEERPLFALLMADALKNGRDVRKWDQSALLLDVIDRDRRQFWLPCAGQLGMGTTLISIAREERALAIATMVGTTSDPLKRSEIEAHHHKLLPSWDVDRHPIFFSSIAGAKHHEAISPIEPDLIGEFFALNALSELSKDDTQDLVRLSWSMRAESMAYFIVRCAMDYPDHTLIPTLHTIEPWDTETAESWSLAAFYLIMLAIKDTRPLSVQATGLEQPSLLKLDKAEYLQAKIKRLATSYPSSFLRYVWGMAVANLLCLLASINRRLADDLCTELKEQSRRHPTEDKLRHLAAQGIAAHYGLLVLRIGVEEKDLRYLVDDLSDDETNLIQHYMMVRYAIAGM